MSGPQMLVPSFPDRPLPAHRQALMRAVLVNDLAPLRKSRRSSRRLRLLVEGLLVGALAGTTGAVVYHQVDEVTDTSSAQCFATASYTGTVQSHTTLSKSAPTGTTPVDGAIDACSAMWSGASSS